VGSQTVGWSVSGVKDGKYAAVLTAANDIGTVTHTALFRIDTIPPRLRALSLRRLRFTVSEPVTVHLTINGRRITRAVGAGSFSFSVARVRTVRITATDAAGNVSQTLRHP
jgi:hypothetical protein